MKIKISPLLLYFARAGGAIILSGCAVYPTGGGDASGTGRNGRAGMAAVPYSVETYDGHPYYDRGFHERRDLGDRLDRRH
ncbi:MAG: hypothetical protein H7244_15270 [Herminiimonas sp.]|nr:hypothetical protein [Herminiimonas sp.]